ncbi:MAG TPA: CpsB/CapC family capsule biosynthesis tyrosine phosphatase [Myxococcales bacterium]|nr:CpsB/CapC family capsule biosynthesis tyrosine phosphatase [Myxococcales bacterium]
MSLSGYIDLHCHLLPAVDDGAKTLEESLAMARSLAAAGFSDVAPSPHAWPEFPDAAAVAERRAEVGRKLAEEGIELSLHPNAENRLDPELFDRIERGDARTLGQGKYLLVEAPFQAPLPKLLDLIFRLRVAGFTPLVAHPERCFEFRERPERGRQAVEGGARLQMELGALTNRYGPEARKLAERFLDDGLYAVAATDLHGPVGAERWIPEAIDELRRRAGEAAVDRLLRDNPARALRGEPMPAEEGA